MIHTFYSNVDYELVTCIRCRKPRAEFLYYSPYEGGRYKKCRLCRKAAAEYRSNNGHLNRAAVHRYRAKRANAPGEGMTKEREAFLATIYGNRCWWCNVEMTPHGNKLPTSRQLEHIHPISSQAPSHIDRDLVWACKSCNISRGNTPALEYAERVWGVEFSGVSWEMTTRVLEAERRNVFRS